MPSTEGLDIPLRHLTTLIIREVLQSQLSAVADLVRIQHLRILLAPWSVVRMLLDAFGPRDESMPSLEELEVDIEDWQHVDGDLLWRSLRRMPMLHTLKLQTSYQCNAVREIEGFYPGTLANAHLSQKIHTLRSQEIWSVVCPYTT